MIFIGNPPFQSREKRGKTQHKIWIDFTKMVYSKMKEGDELLWITPQSWGSPSNKVFKIFKESEIEYINLDTGEYFPKVGSSFSDFLLSKGSNNTRETRIIKDNKEIKLKIDNSLLYFPNDVNLTSLSIHSKAMFSQKNKLPVCWDYVTCHNILLKRSDTLSKTKTKKHVYPVFHTNKQVWWSSVQQGFSNQKKVLWTRSGYTKPFYDAGKYGTTDMGYYVLCSSEAEGERVAKVLNSKLFQYIFTTAKWSGFGNEIVFTNLPDVRLLQGTSDSYIYQWFNLSKDEIKYIENLPLSKKNNRVKNKIIKSKERSDNFGEVFTPKEKVVMMLDSLDKERWSDKDIKFIDPACGNGNFLIEIVKRKIKNGSSKWQALSTTYGVDIMKDNVLECRERLLKAAEAKEEKFRELVQKRIVCADTLTYDLEDLFK